MPIYLHLANLIILKTAVEKKYPGGIDQFRIDYGIGEDNYNQEDNELFAIASMNTDDFDYEQLITDGLHFDEELQFSTDFTVMSRYGFFFWKTDWIEDNKVFAWHIETNKEAIERANYIANLTFEYIQKKSDEGVNLFETII